MPLSPCPPEYCSQNRDKIDGYCQELGFPPGNKIIMTMPDGVRCYCVCGGGGNKAAAKKKATTKKN